MSAALRVLLNGYDYLVLYLGLALLGILCLAWTPVAMIIGPLLSECRGRKLGRYVIMAAFRFYLASFVFKTNHINSLCQIGKTKLFRLVHDE